MKALFVCGRFDENNGCPSVSGNIISIGLQGVLDAKVMNGGNVNSLASIEEEIKDYEVIIWMATDSEIVNRIKTLNPGCLLIISKRNDGGVYPLYDIVKWARKREADFIIETRIQMKTSVLIGRIIDCSGNVIQDWTDDFSKIGETIGKL